MSDVADRATKRAVRFAVSPFLSIFVLDNIVLQHTKMNNNGILTKAEAIEHMADFWKLLTKNEQAIISDALTVRSLKKNEIIYHEGEFPNDLLCLITGKVKIFRNGVCRRSQIIRVIKPVEYFGYRAYLAGEKEYITAASAFERSVICSFPNRILEDIMNHNNRLAMYFNKLMAIDLGVADRRTVSLTQKHIRGRLAESLLFLKENYGVEEDESTLSIYLSREDLANLSNMTTSNAIRTLSLFSAEKLIAIDGRKIKLIDEDSLRKISRLG